MKKLILFIAFALLFTIFSCTPDEYETTTKKNEKVGTPSAYEPNGPGDTPGGAPPPPPPAP
ncbi:hypothetical protein [Flavobacterium johnsoniae]|uniref:hypothetical protein n=1 Tax=Flavobacterium johnsoniae TaxID=986 RepID=UPI000302122E|nr:hypothetical protein [Flavobacterium johnsoniae]OXG01940.1 hypothetical protein B0A63_04580 [Flavobacterium johnsoniae UW101]WQG80299.1 hypothetical protein SR927_20035 [Flavobacterium johnsoniae UW101]SHK99698.1 hypothetical protein SAMN05444146_2606 [Flavobacterium johnsoniae]